MFDARESRIDPKTSFSFFPFFSLSRSLLLIGTILALVLFFFPTSSIPPPSSSSTSLMNDEALVLFLPPTQKPRGIGNLFFLHPRRGPSLLVLLFCISRKLHLQWRTNRETLRTAISLPPCLFSCSPVATIPLIIYNQDLFCPDLKTHTHTSSVIAQPSLLFFHQKLSTQGGQGYNTTRCLFVISATFPLVMLHCSAYQSWWLVFVDQMLVVPAFLIKRRH